MALAEASSPLKTKGDKYTFITMTTILIFTIPLGFTPFFKKMLPNLITSLFWIPNYSEINLQCWAVLEPFSSL